MNILKRTSLFAGLILVTSAAFAQAAPSDNSAMGTTGSAAGNSPAMSTGTNGSAMDTSTSGASNAGTTMSGDSISKMPATHRNKMKKHKGESKMHNSSSSATSPTSGTSESASASGSAAPLSTTAAPQNPNNPHSKQVPGAQNNQLYNGGK